MDKWKPETIIDGPGDLESKLQQLADDAIKHAKIPSTDPQLINVPFAMKAIVLFEFSLGFLCFSYPGLKYLRTKILDVFREHVLSGGINGQQHPQGRVTPDTTLAGQAPG